MKPSQLAPKDRRLDVRVGAETEELLDRIAAEMHATRSYVVRLAIHALAKQRLKEKG